MNAMSWASRSQLPARAATQPAAPSAFSRFLSTFARDSFAYFRACCARDLSPLPFDFARLRVLDFDRLLLVFEPLRLAVFVAIEKPPRPSSPLPRRRKATHGPANPYETAASAGRPL